MSEQALQTVEDKPNGTLPVAATPMEMLASAVSSGASVETLERLMSLQERWEANNARKAFDEAMANLRADLPEIVKTSTVDYKPDDKPRVHYKYESLDAVTSALSPVMASHGLSFRWRTEQRDGNVFVTCIIAHKDGHYEETTLCAAPDTSGGKSGIKAMGSTVTYLQRYTLKAAVGVAASHDDDGTAATIPQSNSENPAPQTEPTLPKQKARDLYKELQQDIDSSDSLGTLESWATNRRDDIAMLPEDWQAQLRSRYADKKLDLTFPAENPNGEAHVQ